MKKYSLFNSLVLALLIHLVFLLFYHAKEPVLQTPRPAMQIFLEALRPKVIPTPNRSPPAVNPSIKKRVPSTTAKPRQTARQSLNALHAKEATNSTRDKTLPGPKLDLSIPKDVINPEPESPPKIAGLKPPTKTPRSELAKSLDKANRPDCKKAYSGLGLLAVVPLIADAVNNSGCQW
ncbi:hypothetical protein [Iodobacter ciconiae]|uniref:Uncharacterized protein n=1 Tax=Iodobacter ciconiae TaxID=2496266 RepID=A0A3S8ZRE3_9NEIS|nr:hypothetical protein [Iodobacter ciconiae]AZN35985.1 hypothetical protein EJO50_05520 [Iodobacter ciconiae]